MLTESLTSLTVSSDDVEVVLEGTLDDGVGVLATDEGTNVGLLAEQSEFVSFSRSFMPRWMCPWRCPYMLTIDFSISPVLNLSAPADLVEHLRELLSA
jgi:hypothetical protein